KPLGDFWQGQARQALPYRLLTLALAAPERKILHERIAQRFRAMLAAGLVGEVEGLREKYQLTADLPSMRCVGYRQVWEMLAGHLPGAELADRGIFATRQFAKRQLTWLRALREAGAIGVELDLGSGLAEPATAARIGSHIARHCENAAGPQA
ncbi:MAG: hypothetical protein KGZ43_06060, partial [Sulfuritalea sp.]|nr:hypothetical protein [Sulfuritalea sp.]